MKKIFLAILAVAAIFTVSAQYKAPQIVANGGYDIAFEKGARNSMSALKAAQKAKFYASECDVNLTKDGKVLVVQSGLHPSSKVKPRVDVQRTTAEKIQEIPFLNGESVCTIEQFLKRASKKPKTKLILDVKNQGTPKRETELIKKVVAAVKAAGMEANVEYIADHPWTCFQLVKYASKESKVHYLGGNYEPEYVKAMGCAGIDYQFDKIKKKKEWIKQAHKLGLTVNVWTVNREDRIRWCIQNGVDFITTDDPDLVKKVIKEMCK